MNALVAHNSKAWDKKVEIQAMNGLLLLSSRLSNKQKKAIGI